jgi:hypothetical protein
LTGKEHIFGEVTGFSVREFASALCLTRKWIWPHCALFQLNSSPYSDFAHNDFVLFCIFIMDVVLNQLKILHITRLWQLKGFLKTLRTVFYYCIQNCADFGRTLHLCILCTSDSCCYFSVQNYGSDLSK